MINPNSWHPYPRYGLAAAMVENNVTQLDFQNLEELVGLARKALKKGLNSYLLRTTDDPNTDTKLAYKYVFGEDVNPGNKNGQGSKFGYFMAPHVLTENNPAPAVSKIRDLIERLSEPDQNPDKSYELTKSFAPMITKTNHGNLSMANPKVGLLIASYTAIATLTELKPSVYARVPLTSDKNPDYANFGIILDLPLWDETNLTDRPLIDFISIFKDLSQNYDETGKFIGFPKAVKSGSETEGDSPEDELLTKDEQKVATNKKKAPKKVVFTYGRPAIFDGNYPGAAKSGTLGAVSLVAAIGRWARQGKTLLLDNPEGEAKRVLMHLAERPLYIVSYEGTRQESFGFHLVDLTLNTDLSSITKGLNNVRLLGIGETEKFKTTKWQTFRMMSDRFLRLYTPASFQDFLAFRAEYPASLKPLLEHYMAQQSEKLSLAIIQSARAYGESLNNAAFFAAEDEMKDDARRQNKPKPTPEMKEKPEYKTKRNQYKDRILTQFESTIGSAKSSAALFSQLGTIAGRLTHREIKPEAGEFMEAVLTNDVSIDDAKNLITAFMRISTFKSTISDSLGVVHEDDEEAELADTRTTTEDKN